MLWAHRDCTSGWRLSRFGGCSGSREGVVSWTVRNPNAPLVASSGEVASSSIRAFCWVLADLHMLARWPFFWHLEQVSL